MNFVILLLNFDEFLSEFHEELQKITDILDIFTKLPKIFGKLLEISGFCEEFHSSVSLFSIDSLTPGPPAWGPRARTTGRGRLLSPTRYSPLSTASHGRRSVLGCIDADFDAEKIIFQHFS